MQTLATTTINHNSTSPFILALIFGLVPSILWLFFWLREDNHHPEPRGLLVITFIAGMLTVIVVLPIQKLIASAVNDPIVRTTLWAASEEILKYLAFAAVIFRSQFLDEPVDYPIYLMAAALGFAALENTFFLVHPLSTNEVTVSFLTGNLRYLGATLLHSVTSGFLGICMGLAYFKVSSIRKTYWLLGLLGAICLHAVFNFFIIEKSQENLFQIFGFLWVTAIIIMLLFEKLRRMGRYVEHISSTTAIS